MDITPETYSISPTTARQELDELREGLSDDEFDIVRLLQERGRALRAEAIVQLSSRLFRGLVLVAQRERRR